MNTIFEGVSVVANRDREAYISIHPGYSKSGYNVPARLAHIQQFKTKAAAEKALSTLKEETVTQEGEQKFGTRKWQQIYYFQKLNSLDDDTGYLGYQEDIGMVFNDNGGYPRER
ncbi:hypothetical protein [Halospeciosus flavus]|uniref:hypothetical protein n=1 Tax=Halospeciosus flavus TaxID=3032283 RepID=UPI00361E8FD9